MKVAIIGTGNMGAGLATELAAAKFEVIIGSRDPAKAAALAEKIGGGAQGGGIAAAFKLADIAILALPSSRPHACCHASSRYRKRWGGLAITMYSSRR